MAFKTLLKEIEDKFNEINNFSEEPESNDTVYFIEVAVRDARKALETAQFDLPGYRVYIDNKTLWMDGTTVYCSYVEKVIEELINLFQEFGIEIINSNVGELAEASTSGGAGAYLTPYAFGHEAPESAITSYGMKKVGKSNKNTKSLKESNYKKMMSEMYSILEEGRYNDIKNDPNVPANKKVNYAIAEVYTKLYEIEKIVAKSIKLKNEMNVDSRSYWMPTKRKLSKLSERLNRVSSYLKNLSA